MKRAKKEPQLTRCLKDCKGNEIAPGKFSGCSCYEGKLANGRKQPKGFKCDCPNHPKPKDAGAVHHY
jgi:hypothetical protein